MALPLINPRLRETKSGAARTFKSTPTFLNISCHCQWHLTASQGSDADLNPDLAVFWTKSKGTKISAFITRTTDHNYPTIQIVARLDDSPTRGYF